MNIDLTGVVVEPVDDGVLAFRGSLGVVLERVAPLAAMTPEMEPEEHIRRLGEAINVVLDALTELTGVTDVQRLPELIDRVTELAVTGDNLEVQVGVAGDLRVDKRNRLVVDDIIAAFNRVPPAVRPAATREAIMSLRRLLALLLLRGWTDDINTEAERRKAARRAIVDTVQGQLYA